MNVLKAGSIVEHGDNRSKNDCIPIQLSQKFKDFATGVVVRCRPLGMLRMSDEAGEDAKLLAVPINKLCNLYQDINSCEDLPQLVRSQIAHFFAHYKDLEEGKWVKIQGWDGVESAKSEILAGIQRFNSTINKPMF